MTKMTTDIPALRAALAAAKMDTPLDAEGFIVFGADGEVVAECNDSVQDARLTALAVNALHGLLDRLEKLERVAKAGNVLVRELNVEPVCPACGCVMSHDEVVPCPYEATRAALADLDGGNG